MRLIDKLKHYIFFILVSLVCFNIANAQISITEIMYDSKGADIDWIEVYNGDSTDVDLTALKLLISNSTSNHEINGYSGTQFLKPAGYGVIIVNSQIASFVSKWSNISPLFTSSFSLPNLKDDEQATVSINNSDKDSPIDSITYSKIHGASDNGNSLQLINSDWTESIPTPTKENYYTNDVEDNNDNATVESDSITTSSESFRSSSGSSSKKEETEELKINTKIVAKNVVFSSVNFPIESLTTTNRKTTLAVGEYIWNFGDGTKSKEISATTFNHIYYFPGEYVVTLSYYEKIGSFKPSASDRLIIKAIPADIAISSVGDNADSFVELENKSVYELDLSGWKIKSSTHYFIIPDGTVLLSNKKLKLSSRNTGFDINDLSYLSILNPRGDILDVYPKSVPISTTKKTISLSRGATSPPKISEVIKPVINENKKEVINLNNLGASAKDSKVKNSNFTYSLLGLLVIISLGIVSFLLIKKNKQVGGPIERSVKAEDMTIVE